ncbi:APO protein 4, mitochondrial-like [Silene latifolia]|uniref:APO protein 4, mitochondrial-like n=1 Tax=Silene latifolia TaxID=37657 RepID=UPI003D7864B9
MALIRPINWVQITNNTLISSNLYNYEMGMRRQRWYCANNMSKEDLKNLIKSRIQNRSHFNPPRSMLPLAQQVLQARSQLIFGVSTLLRAFPVLTCKFCPEIYVGETGHLIQSCGGYKRLDKKHLHEWTRASLQDILVPVETFHLGSRVQDVIEHRQRFNFDRVPAVVELCHQAGTHLEDPNLQYSNASSRLIIDRTSIKADSLSTDELKVIGTRTLKAWEMLRKGVEKLLLVYPAKVCKRCLEVHVGPSGHMTRLCGVFKYQKKENHFWQKAHVDDLVPPKIAWCRRPQDPPVLLNEGRNYYGRAPAVVDLCCKAGATPPVKYICIMKVQGMTKPPLDKVSG